MVWFVEWSGVEWSGVEWSGGVVLCSTDLTLTLTLTRHRYRYHIMITYHDTHTPLITYHMICMPMPIPWRVAWRPTYRGRGPSARVLINASAALREALGKIKELTDRGYPLFREYHRDLLGGWQWHNPLHVVFLVWRGVATVGEWRRCGGKID